ncbi:hypothetical protein [Phytohabitans rumicis]|uniref:Uncharacterized protein n=1 Tax=Phytohabitans rumicis TaxID=1076125 RepID=A0A6V8L995_9ACTN|nr:hypothetical protein [Phytohabitans rumicis]GFJ91568.1 hypothetical protein Prum_052100 [Phytohabitans rumicis]
MAELTIAQRVQAGADLLDRSWPDWWQLIDLDLLDVGAPECCPLGQLFGSWNEAPDGLAMDADRGFYRATQWPGVGDRTDAAVEKVDRAIRVEYAELTEGWRALIEERRSGVPA